ncbi:hypothetical protein A3Q56_01135 [Intoshia linei]|uniref:Uncharacterized protein n=1 Tax=Intoshia linei TaxID=1819745 RepID=A0A177BAA2_9BILA|nr:hypothetical protein A3Q56_01135 [Intoshia linei]
MFNIADKMENIGHMHIPCDIRHTRDNINEFFQMVDKIDGSNFRLNVNRTNIKVRVSRENNNIYCIMHLNRGDEYGQRLNRLTYKRFYLIVRSGFYDYKNKNLIPNNERIIYHSGNNQRCTDDVFYKHRYLSGSS